MPQFNIVIIGGGIAGLGAAIALSRDGHKVTVYERRADTQEVSGSGLQIQPSAIKILRKWNLMDQFRKVAHESHAIKMTRYADGELIAEHKRVGPRGQWYCLRNSMRKFLHEVAIASGATVHLNTRIRSLDFETPSLKLENGETVTADLIIAADGKNSAIRQTMFPGSERELTDTYVFQANIPREAMYQEDYTKDFYNDPSVRIYLGPSQWSFISPAPNQDIYDMQFVSRDFGETGRDPKPERELETLENLDMIGDQVDKWNPEYKGILAKATTFFKWRVALAPEIPTALAKGGKVVLIGDACHGIDPSMGFGSALSLEDGVAIAATLRRAPSKGEIPTLLAVFDEVMRARAGIIGRYSTINGALFGIPDGEFQQRRDAAMKVFDPNGNLNAEPNAKAKYGTSEYQAYLDDYDPEKAVEEALRKHAQENALPPGSVASRI